MTAARRRPARKVAAGGAAGAATTLLVFIAARLGLQVPPEVAAALTTLLSLAASYLR